MWKSMQHSCFTNRYTVYPLESLKKKVAFNRDTPTWIYQYRVHVRQLANSLLYVGKGLEKNTYRDQESGVYGQWERASKVTMLLQWDGFVYIYEG